LRGIVADKDEAEIRRLRGAFLRAPDSAQKRRIQRETDQLVKKSKSKPNKSK
jgi:hypothetical protein